MHTLPVGLAILIFLLVPLSPFLLLALLIDLIRRRRRKAFELANGDTTPRARPQNSGEGVLLILLAVLFVFPAAFIVLITSAFSSLPGVKVHVVIALVLVFAGLALIYQGIRQLLK